MSHLYAPVKVESSYARKNWNGTPEEYQHALDTSSTVYVGNLSFFTREEQIWELFSKVGEVKRIVMGLNKFELTPCGFCFVEYYTHEAAADCVNYVSGTKLDERVIRADWDTGFVEGRQYGRGSTGGQVRDDFREYFDPERGDKQRGGASSHPEQSPSSSRHLPSSHASNQGHHHEDRYLDRGDAHRNRFGPPTPGKGFSPSHDRQHPYEHERSEDHYRGSNDDIDRYSSRGHRDYRDRNDYESRHHSSHSRDYYGHDNRHKRGRDDFEQRHSMEPAVDEFGRDIPAPKKPKLSDR